MSNFFLANLAEIELEAFGTRVPYSFDWNTTTARAGYPFMG